MQKRCGRLNNKGFTMIELAIVLVIIGLLVAGVLKGRELITSAKVKNVTLQVKAVEAAVHTYQDKYRALPGDDIKASTRGFSPAAAGDGSGEGKITGASEPFLVPNHLAVSGLITGSYNGTSDNMQSKLGTNVTVATEEAGVQTKKGLNIMVENLPFEIAKAVDEAMDDGKYDTGSIVSAQKYDGTDALASIYYFF